MKTKTKLLGAVLAVVMLFAVAAPVTAENAIVDEAVEIGSVGVSTANSSGCGRPIVLIKMEYIKGTCMEIIGETPGCTQPVALCFWSCSPSCVPNSHNGTRLNCWAGCEIITGRITGFC